jgi:hypothetical protein
LFKIYYHRGLKNTMQTELMGIFGPGGVDVPKTGDCVRAAAQWLAEQQVVAPLSQMTMADYVRRVRARLERLSKSADLVPVGTPSSPVVQAPSCHFQWYFDTVSMFVRDAQPSQAVKRCRQVAAGMLPLVEHQEQWQQMLVLLVLWPFLLSSESFFDVLSGIMARDVVGIDCLFGRHVRYLLQIDDISVPTVFFLILFRAACQSMDAFAMVVLADMVMDAVAFKHGLDGFFSPVLTAKDGLLPYSFFVGTGSNGQSRWCSKYMSHALSHQEQHDWLAAMLHDLKFNLSSARHLQEAVNACEQCILTMDFTLWQQHKSALLADWHDHTDALQAYINRLKRPIISPG